MPPSPKRKGAPAANDQKVTDHVPRVVSTGHPILSLRHVQANFGVKQMTAEQCQQFLLKWHQRSQLTWATLATHKKHGLGSEKLPSKKLKPKIPETLKQDEYKVFRHHGNLPFVGIQAGDLFYVLWIECKYGDLYDHGGS